MVKNPMAMFFAYLLFLGNLSAGFAFCGEVEVRAIVAPEAITVSEPEAGTYPVNSALEVMWSKPKASFDRYVVLVGCDLFPTGNQFVPYVVFLDGAFPPITDKDRTWSSMTVTAEFVDRVVGNFSRIVGNPNTVEQISAHLFMEVHGEILDTNGAVKKTVAIGRSQLFTLSKTVLVPVVVSAGAVTPGLNAGQLFSWTLNITNSDGATITMDWGDDTTSVPVSNLQNNNFLFQHKYARMGKYDLLLTVVKGGVKTKKWFTAEIKPEVISLRVEGAKVTVGAVPVSMTVLYQTLTNGKVIITLIPKERQKGQPRTKLGTVPVQ